MLVNKLNQQHMSLNLRILFVIVDPYNDEKENKWYKIYKQLIILNIMSKGTQLSRSKINKKANDIR